MGLLRLFLAIVVAAGHLASLLFPDTADWRERMLFGINGGAAVMMFFVVSGFLMSYVLDRKYAADTVGTLAFYRARFLRIYPLWWTMLAVVVIFLQHGWMNHPFIDIASTVTLIGSDLRTAFADYPHQYATFPDALGLGWSLAVEVSFYLVAPFLLRSTRAAIIVFLAFSISRAVVTWVQPDPGAWWSLNYLFFPHLLPFFLMGHFARLIWTRLQLPTIVGPLLLAATALAFWKGSGTHYATAAVACFALSLPPIFAMTKDIRWMNFCGDLTYPLYLVHRPLIDGGRCIVVGGVDLDTQYVRHIEMMPISPYLQFALAASLFVVFSLVVAYAVHRWMERPLRLKFEALFNLSPALRAPVRIKSPAE
jgi:peptidoglycan/LPS O-acetylase OafA/YrhL